MMDPVNPHLVRDSAYVDEAAMAACGHPNLREFTFSTGEVLKLCPDCGAEDGQACLRRINRGS